LLLQEAFIFQLNQDDDLKVKMVKEDVNPDEVDKLLYSLNKKYSGVRDCKYQPSRLPIES